MSKLLLAEFKKENSIEVTKDEKINAKDIFFQLSSKKDIFRPEDISYKNFQRWAKRNITNFKLEDSNEFYFKENKDYFIKFEGGKTKPQSNYYLTKRTAEKILARSNTTIGSMILDKLFDLFHNIEKYHNSRIDVKTGFKPLTDAIMEAHDPVKPYHYSNEANLLNRLVTGLSAKQFKEKYGTDNVRDHLTPEQVSLMGKLQYMNTGMIMQGLDYECRKQSLTNYIENKVLQFKQHSQIKTKVS